jgi:gas vesicle protein
MTDEDGYGEEGYTVMGRDHYTAERGHSHLWDILSFVLGGMVGGGIALLLTPQTGSMTRQMLKEASLDARDGAEVCFNQIRAKVVDAASRGRDLVFESRPLLGTAIEAGREAYRTEKQKRIDGATHTI